MGFSGVIHYTHMMIDSIYYMSTKAFDWCLKCSVDLFRFLLGHRSASFKLESFSCVFKCAYIIFPPFLKDMFKKKICF